MLAEKKILHHNFTDAMYNDTPFGYDLFLHDEQIAIFTPRSLRASNLTMSILKETMLTQMNRKRKSKRM